MVLDLLLSFECLPWMGVNVAPKSFLMCYLL